jgi:hypothetical protein
MAERHRGCDSVLSIEHGDSRLARRRPGARSRITWPHPEMACVKSTHRNQRNGKTLLSAQDGAMECAVLGDEVSDGPVRTMA